jgi:hypothetical protein
MLSQSTASSSPVAVFTSVSNSNIPGIVTPTFSRDIYIYIYTRGAGAWRIRRELTGASALSLVAASKTKALLLAADVAAISAAKATAVSAACERPTH